MIRFATYIGLLAFFTLAASIAALPVNKAHAQQVQCENLASGKLLFTKGDKQVVYKCGNKKKCLRTTGRTCYKYGYYFSCKASSPEGVLLRGPSPKIVFGEGASPKAVANCESVPDWVLQNISMQMDMYW